MNKRLFAVDREVYNLINEELDRQRNVIELIASENAVSEAVLEATGSVLTNKYSEGYPQKRYYGGCEVVDKIEQLAIDRACELFNCKFANVQPHSGSQANMGVYMAVLQVGDTVLGMDLSNGGHLTHGSPVNFSGRLYNFVSYGLDKETEMINYDEVRRIALECKPKLIVAGASAYSRIIDFAKFREIADEVGALFMVDMAHIAGLVATGFHPSPFPYADVVTTTTHKTLRGTRGGMILTNDEELAKMINKNIFPAIQGGALQHVIGAKAVCFKEALQPEFKEYIKNVVENCSELANQLINKGFKIVSGGTDNHLFLIDLSDKDVTGKEAEQFLDKIGITVNKNTVPNEKRSPFVTSGIRVGTATVTTRGFQKEDMGEIADIIYEAIENINDEAVMEGLKARVSALCKKYPLY